MTGDVAQSLARAERAITSARALWREALMPEAEEVLAGALRTLIEVWARRAPESPAPAPHEDAPAAESELAPETAHSKYAAALAALGSARYRTLARLERALAAVDAPRAPVDAGHAATLSANFETVAAETERLYAFTRRKLAPPLSPRARRIRLWLGIGTASVVALVVAWRLWGRPLATASAVYSWDHPATNAIDGLDATEWLLPDGASGWLEIRFPWSRNIRQVRLLNCHNIYYMDRGAERVRVTAFGPQGEIASVQGHFTKISGKRNPIDLKLKADGVTRLRVEVLSHFASGGGLAEVEWR